MRKYITITAFLSTFCAIGIAQQTPVYSQYVLNEFIINPSVAGVDGMTTINVSGRRQWLGWEFGPETYSASISTRILKSNQVIVDRTQISNRSRLKRNSSGKVGLGAAVISDKNGAINKTGLNLTYAYHIFINNNAQLSFGLSFLAQQFNINKELAQFSTQNGVDPIEGWLGKSTYIPDAAFGMHYSTKHYNFGFSSFQLFQSPIKFGEIELNYKELKQIRHYHLHGTYKNKFKSAPLLEYEPSMLIRMTEKLQTSSDLSIRFIYNSAYWAGLSFRTSGELIFLAGIKYNRLYFGYSFDYGFNEFSRLSYGSHEALLAIKLGDNARRYRYWERY
jgi:type IX secretion system PorP/SprF family membrane protein